MILYVDKGIGRAEVNADIVGKQAEKSIKH
jgi:hypothetical protein